MTKASSLIVLLGMLTVAGGAIAQSREHQAMADATRGIASTIGLSPEGLNIYVDYAIANSSPDRWKRLTELKLALAKELASSSPNRERLSQIVDDQAAEAARLEALDEKQLIDLAFRLSESDRQKLGRFIALESEKELIRSRPVLRMLPSPH